MALDQADLQRLLTMKRQRQTEARERVAHASARLDWAQAAYEEATDVARHLTMIIAQRKLVAAGTATSTDRYLLATAEKEYATLTGSEI